VVAGRGIDVDMTVVVLDVFGENLGQISLVEDQHPVEHLTAERAEVPPSFRTVSLFHRDLAVLEVTG
jgi:hypothetical protein